MASVPAAAHCRCDDDVLQEAEALSLSTYFGSGAIDSGLLFACFGPLRGFVDTRRVEFNRYYFRFGSQEMLQQAESHMRKAQAALGEGQYEKAVEHAILQQHLTDRASAVFAAACTLLRPPAAVLGQHGGQHDPWVQGDLVTCRNAGCHLRSHKKNLSLYKSGGAESATCPIDQAKAAKGQYEKAVEHGDLVTCRNAGCHLRSHTKNLYLYKSGGRKGGTCPIDQAKAAQGQAQQTNKRPASGVMLLLFPAFRIVLDWVFPLRGTKLDKQLTLAKRKGDCWAPFIAAMSEPALDIALSAGAPDRLIDLVSVVRSEGKPFFDEAFQHGRSIESRVASGHLEGSLGYGALAVGPLAGVSKMDIHKRWQTQPNVGCEQHVLSRRWCAPIARSAEERNGPPDVPWTPANVDWITKALLSERELFARMAERRFAQVPDLIQTCLRRRRRKNSWHYDTIPEVFGDFLYESSQLLLALLTQNGTEQAGQATWPANGKRWPSMKVATQTTCKRRRVA
ncbi:unnamed protein product [Symbiodinium sp. KB8]|nr:unnamed protein product [Symbiodinium sp. KB8]